jgi:predicted Zn-dependent protease with MMP-like domain
MLQLARIIVVPVKISKAQFAQLVEEALEELPDQFAEFLEEVPLEIRDRPTPEQLRKGRVGRGSLLLGLYLGRPLTMRHVEDSGVMPDSIYIFQEPIQQVCNTPEQLKRQVRVTVLHEIGHHFGLNEDDLEELGYR